MTIGVLIAVHGSRESAVAAAVGAAPGLSVARRCADLSEALAAARAGIGSVVLVSEQTHLHRGVVADFAAAGVAVVGVPSSPDGADHLRGLGIAHLLTADDDAGALLTLVGGASGRAAPAEIPQDAARAESTQRGVIIAVWGPTGAPGRTTLAVSMAYDLALAEPTIIVDVDTYGGAVAQALGLLDEAPGIAALARASLHGALSEDTVRRHALHAAPGLRVLSGVTRADRWTELSAAALEPVWELLRSQAAVTVVDCGFGLERDEDLQYDTHAPQRNGATLSALAAADVVVAVGSAEPLGIQRLVHSLAELDAVVPAETTPRLVVVNRVRAAVAGQRPREAVADALRRYSAVEKVWAVGWDPRACDAATLAGQALGERAPRSAARKGIHAVAVAARRAAVPAPSGS
jgi:MinD-like ATPase involved in chromosome partitioning or flagellar assembly